ncbi:gephyrin-like molybdotransferase Glp [Anaeroselena agilis]|uniref:Molybdopterin molybdenumtransferase n=1 Tax=Anaeroselena agilis TaxID=3063788 RepID=A0ABU3NSM1_9FIRM|nr:molybdopterin molybdotransferase MoeA [Selenomonadales bacterium 4137-cl]
MKRNVALEEAQDLLLRMACPVKECKIPLFDAAGRVLSREIKAPINLPPFDRSPLDGYAVRAEDIAAASEAYPTSLEVIEEVAAGYAARQRVTAKTAIKVMTGAPIPAGADVVIKHEDVTRTGNICKFFYPLKSGSNIVRTGEDVKKGELIAAPGTHVSPAMVGLIAALGFAEVSVYNKVKVAVISTGDELVDCSQPLQPGKIYNSNLPSLVAACLKLGAKITALGNVPDELDSIADIISLGLADADIVITTGGVSAGDYDVVPDALDRLGINVIYRGVNMKPGSPVLAAEYNNKFIVCLSGNPAAALVTFDLIAVPLIKKKMGLTSYLPTRLDAVFEGEFGKPSPQRRFLRGRLQVNEGANSVTLTGEQSNGVLKSLINCNAYIDVPAGSGRMNAGQDVSVLVVDDVFGH